MKARVKETGEIINVAEDATITLESHDSWGTRIEKKPEDIELIQDIYSPIDWEQRRYEIAKEVLSNYWNDCKYHDTDEACATAIAIADEMIKQLKESEVNND